jgi:hypothetical protein
MTFKILGRLAGVVGVLAITAGLAGCMDVNAEIEVLSATTGKATTSMTIGADFYPMIKAAAADTSNKSEPFCKKDGESLTENADGSATCVTVKEGDLTTLTASDDGSPSDDASFTEVSPGVVKVVFKTADMKSQVAKGAGGEGDAAAADAAQQAQMMAAIKPYFEGHKISITIKGKKITETNMTASGDGTSATTEIPFNDLLDGKASIPDELYAIVDTN